MLSLGQVGQRSNLHIYQKIEVTEQGNMWGSRWKNTCDRRDDDGVFHTKQTRLMRWGVRSN